MTQVVDRLTSALADRYAVERELGAGGMATVYLAHDAKHNRKVAVKVLRPELAAVLGGERFLKEIEVTANLQHPHILPLFDSGEADSFLYYVMPHVAGETLKEKLHREKRLGIEESVAIAKAVAAALHYAHRQGVVNRDIKPENVMLSDGLPVVADFGIARAVESAGEDRLTQTGLAVGTPAYMSPEQAAGEANVDARSDVYALGCLLYEMVTGEQPYTGPTAQAVIAKLFKDPIPSARRLRDAVPEALDSAIRQALGKAPEDRFASAAAFATAIVGGQTAPVQVKEALAIAPAKRTPFVARADERAQLLAALDDAVQGQGSLVLVGGEPGVGKTRLAEEILLEAQRRELLCFIGHCYEGEGTAPYTPFVETLEYAVRAVPEDLFRQALGDAGSEVARIMPQLRRIFPDIPPAIELPPDQQRRYLFNSFREFTERSTLISPLVVLLDDLHWADEPSLLLLEHLAQHIPTQRALFIGTYRDVELDVTRPFAKTLGNLTRQRLAQRITVRRLSEDSVHDLLAALGGGDPATPLVGSIFHETEGNPFFVEEVFRHLREEGKLFDADGKWLTDIDIDQLDVPEGVRLVIGRRLERVGDEVQKVLTVGAMMGRRFHLRVLEELELLSGDGLFDALEEAETAQLVHASTVGRDTVYRFSHELVRQTLVGALSIPKRQRLHLRISQAMERVYPSQLEDRAADYSYHLYQAGAAVDEAKAVYFLSIAGDQALDGVAFEEALVHIERALSIEEDPDPKQHAHLLQKKGTALLGLGRWREAVEQWEAALPHFEALGDVSTVVELCLIISNLRLWQIEVSEALGMSERGLRAVGEEPTRARSRALAVRGLVLGISQDPEQGLALVGDAVSIANDLGDQELLGLVEGFYLLVLNNQGRMHDVVHAADTPLDALRASNQPWQLVQALSNLEHVLIYSGRPEDALALSDEVRTMASQLEHRGASMLDDLAMGYREWFRGGNVDRLIEFGLHGAKTWRPVGPWYHWGDTFASMGLLWKGEWAKAIDRITTVVREFPENWWTGWDPGVGVRRVRLCRDRRCPCRVSGTRASHPAAGQGVVGGRETFCRARD